MLVYALAHYNFRGCVVKVHYTPHTSNNVGEGSTGKAKKFTRNKFSLSQVFKSTCFIMHVDSFSNASA